MGFIFIRLGKGSLIMIKSERKTLKKAFSFLFVIVGLLILAFAFRYSMRIQGHLDSNEITLRLPLNWLVVFDRGRITYVQSLPGKENRSSSIIVLENYSCLVASINPERLAKDLVADLSLSEITDNPQYRPKKSMKNGITFIHYKIDFPAEITREGGTEGFSEADKLTDFYLIWRNRSFVAAKVYGNGNQFLARQAQTIIESVSFQSEICQER